MKTLITTIRAFGLAIFLALGLLGSQTAEARPGERVSFQTFYDELSPYGRWVNDPEYGYVWAPRVEDDFQPYATRGHWVMTEYGNTWVSDYDWGWAPFHYGRWMFDDYFGWLWVPGQDWGPAWVDWRHNNGYYGWAPMGPRVTYIMPVHRWIFVPVRYISSPRIYSYYVPRTRVVNIYHHTTIINNYYERDDRKYVYGPRNQDIERATNRKANVHRVENDSRPGRSAVAGNSLRMYRPAVDAQKTEVPSKVEARQNAAPRSRFNAESPASTRTGRTRSTDGVTSEGVSSSNSETGTRTRTSENRTYQERAAAQPNNSEQPVPVRRQRSVGTSPAGNETRTAEPAGRTAVPNYRDAAAPAAQNARETARPAARERQVQNLPSRNYEPRPSGNTPAAPQPEVRKSRSESGDRAQPAQRTRTSTDAAPARESSRRSRN